MPLSEFYALPEEERKAIMLEIARKATESQIKMLAEYEEIIRQREEDERLGSKLDQTAP